MKYNYIKFIFILFLSVIVVGCDDFLDETPKGQIIPQTVDDFGMILDDATTSYQNYIAYGVSNVSTMDDNIKIISSRESKVYKYELQGYQWADELYNTTQNDYDYTAFYKVIYLSNFILQNIDSAPAGDGKYSRDFVRGSALFNRANAYLNLVNLYAKQYDPSTAGKDLGVAMPLEADPNQRLARETVEVVYGQILKDALEIVQNNYLKEKVKYSFQPSIGAAYSLLMRTYLYMGNYKESFEYAKKARAVVGELSDYNELTLSGNNPDNGIDGNWPGSSYDLYLCPDVICYRFSDYSTNYYYNVSDDLLSVFDKNSDLRYQLFLTKYEWYDDDYEDDGGIRPSIMYDDNKGYSKGEVYITEAETALRLNDIPTALSRLNDLRKGRIKKQLYSNIVETDPEKLMKIILEERRRELMFKGLRWFDLKRLNKETKWQKTITHVLSNGTFVLPANDSRYVLPIPESVIQVNPKIIQNIR